MVTYRYRDFLSDPQQYAQAEAFWRDLWEQMGRLTGQRDEWKHPWLTTTFANGVPFLDGDPIFSAISRTRDLAVRVIQHEPERDEPELDYWVDEFGDEWNKVRVLAISCALSVEVATYARDLFYAWMTEGKVYTVHSQVGPPMVLLPKEAPRRERSLAFAC